MESNQKLAMISQPMGGKTKEEILKERNRLIKHLNAMGYEVVDSFFEEKEYSDENLKKKGIKNNGVYFLGESLKKMAEVDLVYFAKGWGNYKGCVLEHNTAISYGIDVMEDYRKE